MVQIASFEPSPSEAILGTYWKSVVHTAQREHNPHVSFQSPSGVLSMVVASVFCMIE